MGWLDEIYRFMGSRPGAPEPKPVDAGNEEDTLGVNQTPIGVSDMANTSTVPLNGTFIYGNMTTSAALSNYQAYLNYNPYLTKQGLQGAAMVPNTIWYGPSGGQTVPYNPFLLGDPISAAPLIPAPEFSDSQIEEALEFING